MSAPPSRRTSGESSGARRPPPYFFPFVGALVFGIVATGVLLDLYLSVPAGPSVPRAIFEGTARNISGTFVANLTVPSSAAGDVLTLSLFMTPGCPVSYGAQFVCAFYLNNSSGPNAPGMAGPIGGESAIQSAFLPPGVYHLEVQAEGVTVGGSTFPYRYDLVVNLFDLGPPNLPH